MCASVDGDTVNVSRTINYLVEWTARCPQARQPTLFTAVRGYRMLMLPEPYPGKAAILIGAPSIIGNIGEGLCWLAFRST